MLAAGIVAWAVALPGRLGHQLREGLVVPVRNQVARAFPALHVVGGVAPGVAGSSRLPSRNSRYMGVCRTGYFLAMRSMSLNFSWMSSRVRKISRSSTAE